MLLMRFAVYLLVGYTFAQSNPQDTCTYQIHTGEENVMECGDGTRCNGVTEGSDCCSTKGGRKRCPSNFPYMCARENDCGGGTANCCGNGINYCNDKDGLRECIVVTTPAPTEPATTVEPTDPPAATKELKFDLTLSMTRETFDQEKSNIEKGVATKFGLPEDRVSVAAKHRRRALRRVLATVDLEVTLQTTDEQQSTVTSTMSESDFAADLATNINQAIPGGTLYTASNVSTQPTVTDITTTTTQNEYFTATGAGCETNNNCVSTINYDQDTHYPMAVTDTCTITMLKAAIGDIVGWEIFTNTDKMTYTQSGGQPTDISQVAFPSDIQAGDAFNWIIAAPGRTGGSVFRGWKICFLDTGSTVDTCKDWCGSAANYLNPDIRIPWTDYCADGSQFCQNCTQCSDVGAEDFIDPPSSAAGLSMLALFFMFLLM